MRTRVLVLVAVLLGIGLCQDLIKNGDFEQPLAVGWIRTQDGLGTQAVNRDPGYQPDPDYEAMVSQEIGPGWVSLSQVVEVPSVDLTLSFWARFSLGGTSPTCWPAASVVAGYYNSTGSLLGQTRIYCHNEYCTWVRSPTLNLIEVTDSNWTHYSINIRDEIVQHLSGVNPNNVRRVSVSLYDTTAGG